jgi:hypothetical protein
MLAFILFLVLLVVYPPVAFLFLLLAIAKKIFMG